MARKNLQITSCVFDLETLNFNADFGVVLCAVIKAGDEKPVVLRADDYKTWPKNRSNDKELVNDIIKELCRHDIWIAHNGQRFDIPFLKTRAMRWGLDPLPKRKVVDPVLLARSNLRMGYNSLGSVANLLGCNSKTDVLPVHWLEAALDGSKEAMDYIVKHCVEDVYTLEEVVNKLKHYCSTFNTYGSGF